MSQLPFNGLLVHVAAQTEDGFLIFDVFESQQAVERFGKTIGMIPKDVGITEGLKLYPAHTFLSAGQATAPPRAMSSPLPGPESAARTALTRWYAAWNAHDVNAISALMTDDVRYEDPSAPRAVMRGRREVQDYVGAAFAAIPDLQLEKLEEWVTGGGAVIASYFRLSGTFETPLTSPGQPALAPTGQHVEIFGMDRSEIRDERLERHQIFWDMAEFGRQMGFFPPRGSRMETLTRRLQHLTARRLQRRA
jgi:steroid delta-isomerase-like uncharacterized protein